MIDKSIGRRIRACREAKGWTQEALAARLGISVNFLSGIERGTSFPRCESLIRLLNTLEIPADAIFCDAVTASVEDKTCLLARTLDNLPTASRQRILGILDFLIRQGSEEI